MILGSSKVLVQFHLKEPLLCLTFTYVHVVHRAYYTLTYYTLTCVVRNFLTGCLKISQIKHSMT